MRLFIISLSALLATALPAPQTTCGTQKYTAAQITAAKNAACNYVRQGTTAGSSKYPESYQDREGFTFHGVDGPYYEFPILSSGKVYSGGSPGADRIIINDDCILAGEITHTGSSVTNGFVGCAGTS
ncbi:hypothetical protein FKW77_004329 [Venturia effusa]|uniref:ribonuclease T1 n=1 Tax=Venturia effusa TaxID=50376 RepID=A0A517L164_9PEZI|nr:hypothetical protein FKW77_004329 [Venturia effusa]